MKYIILISLFLPSALAAQPFPNDVDGPDAPDMTISWGAGGFTFQLDNPMGSNNEQLMYQESFIQQPLPPDYTLRYQGYMILRLVSHPSTWPGDPGWIFRLNDSTYAIPAMVADLADTVTSAWDLRAGCTSIHWQLPNYGVSSTYTVAVDPITQLPFQAEQEYCFIAVAFATNPYHRDVDCDTLDQLVISTGSAAGAMQYQCVTGSELVGIGEQELDHFQIDHDPRADLLTVSSEHGGNFLLRCTNALGALMIEETSTRASVDLSRWPNGMYHATVMDKRGKVIKPFLIAR